MGFVITLGESITLTITDTVSGVLTDPGAISVAVTDPTLTVTTYTTSSSPALVHVSTGDYTLTLTPVLTGNFSFTGTTTGTAAATYSGTFTVIAAVVAIALPDYSAVYAGPSTTVPMGGSLPVTWLFTRSDGGLVPIPTSASISIARPDGGTDTITGTSVYCSSAAAAASLTIGGSYAFLLAGVYLVTLTVTFNTGTGPVQTVEVELLFKAV